MPLNNAYACQDHITSPYYPIFQVSGDSLVKFFFTRFHFLFVPQVLWNSSKPTACCVMEEAVNYYSIKYMKVV